MYMMHGGMEWKVRCRLQACARTQSLLLGRNDSFKFQFNFYFISSSEFVREDQPTRLLNFLSLITTVKWRHGRFRGGNLSSHHETKNMYVQPRCAYTDWYGTHIKLGRKVK